MRASFFAASIALTAFVACGKRSAGPAPIASVSASASAPAPEVTASASVSARPYLRPEPPEKPGGYVIARVLDVVSIGQGDAVLLVDPANERVVPIFVGGTEALSIRLRAAGERFHRPLTHDLLDSIVKRMGGEVVKVHVDDLKGNTFVGRVYVWTGDRLVDVDARPSDAIAIALGNHAPIYVAKRVFDAAGIRKKDLDDPEHMREILPRAKEPMAL